MFGLYMLAIYLGVAVIAAGFVALLVVVALAVGLVTHPIRTLALVFHKLAALVAGLALILALIAWFWTDHAKPDFIPCFWGIHRCDRRLHHHPRVRRVDSRTAHQGRTPRHETGHHRAGSRPGDDAHAGIGRGGCGVRTWTCRTTPAVATAKPSARS